MPSLWTVQLTQALLGKQRVCMGAREGAHLSIARPAHGRVIQATDMPIG